MPSPPSGPDWGRNNAPAAAAVALATVQGLASADAALLGPSRLLKNWGKGRRVCLWRRIGIFGVWQLAFGAGLKSLKRQA